MIIWLASYPRSGNTLMRNILKKSMGLTSYSKHGSAIASTEALVNDYGVLKCGGTWDECYESAKIVTKQ
ncbi:MAG: hypothetical protein CL866_04615 [Cycloclasticus sp.]|nr:hypothetical protein [Cycloclasticus sp.]MBG96139.1 hypothetical protein [Cycloclasticus sp.]